jgi:membrane-bound serine protease (ClpP class)
VTDVAITIALFVAGVVCLVLEVGVLSGLVLPGIVGAGLLLGSAIFGFVKLGPMWGALSLAGGVVTTVAGAWILPKTRPGKALVLEATQRAARVADSTLAELAGKRGVALTPLRPAGKADIEDRTVDVVTDGLYVEEGAALRVARVEGTRVIVEPEKSS